MGLIQRIVGVVLGLLFLVAVLVFASLALGVLVAVGLIVWGWLWWRTRSLRQPSTSGGIVVEGEYRDITPSGHVHERDRPFP
jgi:hypothetical protein